MQLLLVDDEIAIVQSVAQFLRDLGHDVTTALSATEALAAVTASAFHVVLTDVKMPGMDGIDLLTEIKRCYGLTTAVIVFTGHGDEDLAIRSLRGGAFDYLKKPLNIEELVIALERAEEHLNLKAENEALTTRFDQELEVRTAPLREQVRQVEQALRAELGLDKVHIFSAATRQVFDQARMFHMKRDVPVLIEGESGTGKELIARFLHYGDSPTPGPLVAINCAAMPAELFQTEFFGYEGGAFTGAKVGGNAGKIELAQGGTLFLDEISEISLELQVRLLRVLETREYYRIGGLKKLRTDARFVFSTNRLLADQVSHGSFRRDLYHRINVGHIFIPPLRERREEILPLAEAFLAELNQKHGTHFRGFAADAQQSLYTQEWEGNVRELRNTIERAVILSHGETLSAAALSDEKATAAVPAGLDRDLELPREGFDLQRHEIDIVRRALLLHHGNRTQTARYLGLSLKALQSRLRKL